MKLFGMQWILDALGWRLPNPCGIRQPSRRLMQIAKNLMLFFCSVSPDEFHRISHISIAKEAWQILETTYEGTKKAKETKL